MEEEEEKKEEEGKEEERDYEKEEEEEEEEGGLGATGMWLNTGRMLAAESQAAKYVFPRKSRKRNELQVWTILYPFHHQHSQ